MIDALPNNEQGLAAFAEPLMPSVMAAVARGVIRATVATLPTFLKTPSLRRHSFVAPVC
ncbi:hypothetical protein AB0L00_32595 [Actinoallomurus sp. NPDC052308]|uniref:hypothetical protein n=1 Tax=Actinoallomurus sp. NPDC052308 TaxID=3155530 RepID=UPI003433D319